MPSNPPKLLDRVRLAIRVRHYSHRTEECYVAWVRRYVHFHERRHPAELGAAGVQRFLVALADQANLSASSQAQALSALLFLYRDVLRPDLGPIDRTWRAKQPTRLPVVLDRDEVRRLVAGLEGMPHTVALLLYGSGLRCSRHSSFGSRTWILPCGRSWSGAPGAARTG
jgi:site-specific recombinase XerD